MRSVVFGLASLLTLSLLLPSVSSADELSGRTEPTVAQGRGRKKGKQRYRTIRVRPKGKAPATWLGPSTSNH